MSPWDRLACTASVPSPVTEKKTAHFSACEGVLSGLVMELVREGGWGKTNSYQVPAVCLAQCRCLIHLSCSGGLILVVSILAVGL